MSFHVAGYLLFGFLCLWGVGAALLLTPSRWRRFWVFFAPAFGVALASAVVWVAARHTTLAGADAYAWVALSLPLLLGAAGWRRRGGWRVLRIDLRRGASAYAIAAALLAFLLSPLPRVSASLTSVSLGSCDAADYAAGARVLGEFASDDRSGFIGHTEVVREHSVDNFFDYWLRLNHFTPSALLALGNATFGWEIHESVTLLATVLLAATVPLVFWLARSLFRFGPRAALGVAAIYGLSPLTWYGVWHVALGQALAALGIALLTWAGVVLWREGPDWRRALGFAGMLVAAYWILLGAFNFIILICLAPAAAFVAAQTVRSGDGRRLACWLAAMLAPFALTGVVFAERVLGLAERFRLFAEHDFGWPIPLLGPSGWLGFVADTQLNAPGLRWSVGLSVVFGGLWVAAIQRAGQAGGLRASGAVLAVCALAPVAVGYAYLQFEARSAGSNESYDAYKVLAVFYPVVLPALCFWAARPALRVRWARFAAVAGMTVLIAAHVRTAAHTVTRLEHPPLTVTAPMERVRAIEALTGVTSVNMLVDDFWTRLWSNAFLLRKPQYFQGYTYEGRRGTPLRGQWDLIGGIMQVQTSDGRDGFAVGPSFTLMRADGPHALRAALTDGWYNLEQAPKAAPWRWTRLPAELLLENPHPHPLTVKLELSLGSFVPRDLQVLRNDEPVFRTDIGVELQLLTTPAFLLTPGRNRVALVSDLPPVQPGGGDPRELGFFVTRIVAEIQVAPEGMR